MLTEKIEKLAAQNEEMPLDLDGAEQLLFLSLRQLYATYHAGKISKENARNEKGRIYAQYAQYELNYRCWKQGLEKERKLSGLHQQIKECKCDICRKYIRTLEGLNDV